ncbi:MAG: hypothetical protein M3539_10740 [Acidobacteriota bacterium]|nr:hypothetical protein [Acidobacteriota bacterium]
MKSFVLFIALLCAVTLGSSLTSPVINAASAAKKERAMTTFNDPVKLMGITLKGDYLFVHDDEAMARGESCTFVYKGEAETPRKLVVSFHCIPIVRDKVAYFTTRSVMAEGEQELKEYQFAGSTEAHMVPWHRHAEHFTIATP